MGNRGRTEKGSEYLCWLSLRVFGYPELKISRRKFIIYGDIFKRRGYLELECYELSNSTLFRVDFVDRPERIHQRPVVCGLEVLAKSVHAQNFAWLRRIFMKVVESRTSQGPL